jgi:serine/threonine-protein kinase
MGEVYRAHDTRLNRTVAIKLLSSELAGDERARARFLREAHAVAALDHPNICGIHDVGDSDGTHFIVMPFLDGQTLAERLEKGPLPIDQALKTSAEIADALDRVHRNGIVHRDVKPANIMLTKAGSKLLDFGLAKLKAPASPITLSGMANMATTSPGTAQGTILGTVQYMSPEQVEGKDADARSDIWGLGAVIYEMVTGSRPFTGDTPASVIGSILKDDPPPVSSRQTLAPRALDDLVMECLAKDPDERWQSAGDVARELRWVWGALRDPEQVRPTARPRRQAGSTIGFFSRGRLKRVAIDSSAPPEILGSRLAERRMLECRLTGLPPPRYGTPRRKVRVAGIPVRPADPARRVQLRCARPDGWRGHEEIYGVCLGIPAGRERGPRLGAGQRDYRID